MAKLILLIVVFTWIWKSVAHHADYGIGIVSFANRTYSPMGFVNMQILDTIVKIAKLQPMQLLHQRFWNKEKMTS
jgi:hypothetical protein